MKGNNQLKETLLKEGRFIADLFIDKYSGVNRLVCEKVEAATGRVISRRAIVDELGDYVQNILYLSQITGERRYAIWTLEHIRACVNLCQTESGLFFTERDITLDSSMGRGPLVVYAGRNCDTIQGLAAVYQLTKEGWVLEVINKFFDGVFKYCCINRFITRGAIPSLHITIPLADALATAYFAEALIDLYSLTSEGKYLSRARESLRPYTDGQYFQRYGLFEEGKRLTLLLEIPLNLIYSVLKKPFSLVFLVKSNAYLVQAFLALYRVTEDQTIKDAVDKWLHSVKTKLLDDPGYCHNVWSPRTGRCQPASPLMHSHSLIELLVDIYVDTGEQDCLSLAQKIAHLWLGHKSTRNLIREAREESSQAALLDPQVDFAINLLKLWELTNDEYYLVSAISIFQALIDYHRLPHGYSWSTNYQSGSVLNPCIETKYLGLLLKGFLVLYQVLENRHIFQDDNLRLIARDR